MSTYNLKYDTDMFGDKDFRLTERNIYGSSRIGVESIDEVLASTVSGNVNIDTDLKKQKIGDKRYELANHLGNVLECYIR